LCILVSGTLVYAMLEEGSNSQILSTQGGRVSQHMTDTDSSYDNIIRKHEGVSARYKALSLLVDADPLTIDTQTEILPEIKTWVNESLEVVFSDLGSLTDDDARELARFAVAEPSGLLLKDQYVMHIMQE
jgi:hypothetical protein